MQLTRKSKGTALAATVITCLIALALVAWVIELWRAQDYLQTRIELQAKELDRELTQLSILPRLLSLDPRMTNALTCLLYTSPSPRDATLSRMPSSA